MMGNCYDLDLKLSPEVTCVEGGGLKSNWMMKILSNLQTSPLMTLQLDNIIGRRWNLGGAASLKRAGHGYVNPGGGGLSFPPHPFLSGSSLSSLLPG